MIFAGSCLKPPASSISSGGPMMGFGIFDLNVPTTKTSSALLCLTHDDVAEQPMTACINCGRCVEAVSYTHLQVRRNLESLEGVWNNYQVYLNDEINYINEESVLTELGAKEQTQD